MTVDDPTLGGLLGPVPACPHEACKVCTGCAHAGSRPCAGTVRCPTTGAVSRCRYAPEETS
jgi:hypothetical protein